LRGSGELRSRLSSVHLTHNTHRDLFLRDDRDRISSPDADGRVARGLGGLEGVLCWRLVLDVF
jgi:hypothetical protein